jgi:hypothetical protein
LAIFSVPRFRRFDAPPKGQLAHLPALRYQRRQIRLFRPADLAPLRRGAFSRFYRSKDASP